MLRRDGLLGSHPPTTSRLVNESLEPFLYCVRVKSPLGPDVYAGGVQTDEGGRDDPVGVAQSRLHLRRVYYSTPDPSCLSEPVLLPSPTDVSPPL